MAQGRFLSGSGKTGRALVANAGTLVGSVGVTSGLGFIYWFLAARLFPNAEVGIASAATSAMTLLGTFGVLGLGTLLMGELARQKAEREALVATAVVAAGGAGGLLGLLFALIGGALSPNLQPLAADPATVLLFAFGVSLTAVTLVLDQAVIGLLQGGVQFWRNAIFAAVKLAALVLFAVALHNLTGMAIYGAWVVGNVVSLALLLVYAVGKGARLAAVRVRWSLLRGLGRSALSHHALNLALVAPGMILPLLVTVILSAQTNASFYIAWNIVQLVFVAPAALATVLYAVNAADTAALAHTLRLTLTLAALAGLAANLALFIAGHWLLSLFGTQYVLAETSLHILGLAVFPLIIKDHYVALHRITGQMARATLLVIAGGVGELIMAATGAVVGGLPGLTLFWIIAMLIQVPFMARTVYRAAVPARANTGQPIHAVVSSQM